jgi:hypothetical protein
MGDKGKKDIQKNVQHQQKKKDDKAQAMKEKNHKQPTAG